MAFFLISSMVLGLLASTAHLLTGVFQHLLTGVWAFNRYGATRAVGLDISKVFD